MTTRRKKPRKKRAAPNPPEVQALLERIERKGTARIERAGKMFEQTMNAIATAVLGPVAQDTAEALRKIDAALGEDEEE